MEEYSTEEYTPVENPPSNPGPWNRFLPLFMGLSVIGTLAVGMVVGFLVRPLVIPDRVEVVQVPMTVEGPQTAAAADPAPAAPAETEVGTGAIAESSQAEEEQPDIMAMLLSDARHFSGQPDAPVTIVEFSDFKCGYCGHFYADTLAQLRKEYVDTGKVRFVYKHFAILGAESNRAAEASECAAEQEAFWAYHDTVFDDQTTVRNTLNDEMLVGFAKELGLDVDAFTECLTSDRYTAKIRQEAMTVQSLGVRGTPGFVVNGVYLAGAQPFEVFQQVIEEQLAASDKSEDGEPVGMVPGGR